VQLFFQEHPKNPAKGSGLNETWQGAYFFLHGHVKKEKKKKKKGKKAA